MVTHAHPPRRRFSSDEVLAMVEHGLLVDEHLELVDGELLTMSPKGTRHVAVTSRLVSRLAAAFPDAWVVQEGTLRCGTHDLREPDVMVVRGALDDWLDRYPTGNDLLLVAEVAQASLRHDREKAATYARAGVPEYWILDLASRCVERRRGPTPDGYLSLEVLGPTEVIRRPGAEMGWAIADLLP